jgi:hypothetical protein
VLTIGFGNGQMGMSRVTLDGVLLKIGDIRALAIDGAAPGARLSIKSTATDVNDQSDTVSVQYRLTGGAAPLEFTAEGTAPERGGSVAFRAEIIFEPGPGT